MAKTKQVSSLIITGQEELGAGNYLLHLRPSDGTPLPQMYAGQFVQVQPPGGVTLLRRPISVCNVTADGELWLLIARVGRGTRAITEAQVGEHLDIILPLGNTFATEGVSHPLLVGGGVGIAPMLMLARTFAQAGIRPDILLGGRTSEHIVLREAFECLGDIYYTTDDGSLGVHGRVTDHPVLRDGTHDRIYCCGPHPMMRAIASLTAERGQSCQVSLENMMACGIGACLCCVQDTVSAGHLCVCTDGPVFDALEIKW